MPGVVDVERMEKEPQLRDQQTPLPPPSKVARLSSRAAAGAVTTATATASPTILGLGLGVGVGTGTGRSAFTFLQLQELEHQALIYKYMVAGVPVPLQLVLPIWKSVAAAVSPNSAYTHYPAFMGCGSLCFDYRNSMEPEPGRCRRTDGKKWRCSRDVVPDQKYCERHMHRGRNRSRKPVEAGPAAAGNGGSVAGNGTPAASIANATTEAKPNNHMSSFASSTQLSISISNAGLQLMPPATNSSASSNNSSNVSPPRLGFSPTSVLHNSTTCKTGPT